MVSGDSIEVRGFPNIGIPYSYSANLVAKGGEVDSFSFSPLQGWVAVARSGAT